MDTDVLDRTDWSGSLLVSDASGHVVARSGGRVDGPDSAPCGPETRFQAGSISKSVMSVVVLDLEARGALRLDDPVGTWLPELPGRLRAVTLHELLGQTAGIGHWGDIPGLSPKLSDPPARDALVEAVLAAPPVDEPGRSWRYSGPGFLMVALVVEAVTGRPYGAVAEDVVFAPAGMRATTSGTCPVGDPDVAVGRVDGRPIAVAPGFATIPGTGDVWTTAADLLRNVRALRSGTLTGAATDRTWTPRVILPRSDQDAPTVASGYGYGTFTGRVLGQDAWFVPGDNPGYQSLLAHLPGTATDVVLLTNEADGVQRVLGRLAAAG